MTSTPDTPTDAATPQNDRFDMLLDDLDEMIKMMRALVSPPEERGVDELLEELDEQMSRFEAAIKSAENVQADFKETERRVGAKLEALEQKITSVHRHQMALSEKLGLT